MREGWARLRHLMMKDWRYIRLWAAASALLTATVWPMFLWGDRQFFLVGVVHLSALALPFVAMMRLLQLDPVLGSTSFWATRPIDRTHQLASKLLVGFGTLVVPSVVLQVAPLGLRGLDLLPLDYALASAAAAARYLALSGAVLMIAAVTQRLSQAALLATVLVPVLVLVGQLYTRLWPSNVRTGGISFWYLVFPLLLILQALTCLSVLYRTRHVARAALTFMVMSAGILALGRFWRWELTLFPLRERRSPSTQEDRRDWPIRVSVAGQGWWENGSMNTRVANARAQVEGLPAGIALIQQSYQVERPRPSGGVEKRDLYVPWEGGEFARGRWVPSAVEAATQCGGRGPAEQMEVELYREPGPAIGPSVPRLEGLKGRLAFQVVRPFVARKALVHGGSLAFRGHRIDGSVSATPGGSEVVLRIERLILLPFPGPLVNSISTRPTFFDPVSGDCIAFSGVGGGSRYGAGPLVPLDIRREVFSEWHPMGKPSDHGQPLPRTTEMLLLDYEVLGTLEVPFEFLSGNGQASFQHP